MDVTGHGIDQNAVIGGAHDPVRPVDEIGGGKLEVEIPEHAKRSAKGVTGVSPGVFFSHLPVLHRRHAGLWLRLDSFDGQGIGAGRPARSSIDQAVETHPSFAKQPAQARAGGKVKERVVDLLLDAYLGFPG